MAGIKGDVHKRGEIAGKTPLNPSKKRADNAFSTPKWVDLQSFPTGGNSLIDMEDNSTPLETQDNNRIVPVNIEEQMKTAYIDYSMSVIVGRALPDVRDGLKPVHRRILYGMNELGNNSNKPYKKAARIVGEVMGKYHPHGDASIFDAMVRMAQEWSMRYLLVDGQGNFGNQDGDGPAAMRYIEARLHRLAEYMLEDIEKETVDFQPNFDDSLEEPTVLPTRIPQLLMNGSSGIAVGMATNMMPHNLSEVIDGCIAYIEKRDISVEELMQSHQGARFPYRRDHLWDGRGQGRHAFRPGPGCPAGQAACRYQEPAAGSRSSSPKCLTR